MGQEEIVDSRAICTTPEPAHDARNQARCMRVCLRGFFGYPHCDIVCDTKYLVELKESFWETYMGFLLERVPRYMADQFERRLKNFGP